MEIVKAIYITGCLAVTLGAFCSAILLAFGPRCGRRQAWVSAFFILSYLGIVFWHLPPDVDEWNPNDLTEAEVVGTWSDGKETVVLEANQTFSYRSPSQSVSGTWTRDDWNLKLRDNKLWKKEMRFVRHKGDCLIMPNPPGDPDDWDGKLLSQVGRRQTDSEKASSDGQLPVDSETGRR